MTEGGRVKAELVILPDGEQFKSLEVLQKVWDKALECRCGSGTLGRRRLCWSGRQAVERCCCRGLGM